MTNFKINDLVKIIKKPSANQHIKLVGMIGYVTGFQEVENSEGVLQKYIDFREIEFSSFCGGMGSVDIDCIEHCDDVRYKTRLNEILEKQQKDDKNQAIVSAYTKLEDKLAENKNLISELEKEIFVIKHIFNLLESHAINVESYLNKELIIREDKIIVLKIENDRITEEMNTPINKRVAWYLECQRYG